MSAVALQQDAASQRRGASLRLATPPRRRPRLGFALLMLTLCASAVFATVAVNAMAAGDAVAAVKVDQHLTEAETQYTTLVAEVATLEDPARLTEAAAHLGLVPARGARFLVVDPLPDATASDDPTTGGTPDANGTKNDGTKNDGTKEDDGTRSGSAGNGGTADDDPGTTVGSPTAPRWQPDPLKQVLSLQR